MEYKELYNYKIVPEMVQNVIRSRCQKWDTNGNGYKGKNYSDNPTYQCQLDTNASFSEERTFAIINSAQGQAEINEMLEKAGCKQYLAGYYVLNDLKHGQIYDELDRYTTYTYADIVRAQDNEFNKQAIWSCEVKGTKSFANNPSNLHRADLVFVYYLDLDKITILMPTPDKPRNERTDADYTEIGTLSFKMNFKPITITTDWGIEY